MNRSSDGERSWGSTVSSVLVSVGFLSLALLAVLHTAQQTFLSVPALACLLLSFSAAAFLSREKPARFLTLIGLAVTALSASHVTVAVPFTLSSGDYPLVQPGLWLLSLVALLLCVGPPRNRSSQIEGDPAGAIVFVSVACLVFAVLGYFLLGMCYPLDRSVARGASLNLILVLLSAFVVRNIWTDSPRRGWLRASLWAGLLGMLAAAFLRKVLE